MKCKTSPLTNLIDPDLLVTEWFVLVIKDNAGIMIKKVAAIG